MRASRMAGWVLYSFVLAFSLAWATKYDVGVGGLDPTGLAFQPQKSTIAVSAGGTAPTATAVEYYYADWNFYFVTSFAAEIAALDGGAFGGLWKRTGETFSVWSDATGGGLPTCRFFSTIFDPKSSHFYTPYDNECTSLKAGTAWQYEGIAFYLQLPDATGHCPDGTTILYRLYNNGMGGAPNHRFTASATTFSQMQSAGWSFEGDGRTGAFACVPLANAGAAAEGLWTGTTSANQTVRGIVLDDGTYYILYSRSGNAVDGGVVQGSSSSSNGQFSSPDGMDFPIAAASESGDPPTSATVGGTYAPRSSLQLTVVETGGSRTFTATYDPSYEQPASLAAIAGTYTGSSGHSGGKQQATFTVGANGNLSGSNPVCAFSGTITPHKSVNVFDWSVSGPSGQCIFARTTPSGILYYDQATRQIHGFAPWGGRSDEFYLIGTKQ